MSGDAICSNSDPVLKIANVTWKGRCASHPRYDPRDEGEGGIRGGCRRCYALLAIYQQHDALMRSLREFGHNADRKRRAVDLIAERQQLLFERCD
jgi:hypothetical protein